MTNAHIEIAHRQIAAKHLKGIPARQNLAAIDLLQSKIFLEELASRATPEEWAAMEAKEESLGLIN
jgi:hypothetical protein